MSECSFFNESLLKKYNTSGPRYTSYPTALEFNTQFTDQNLTTALSQSPHTDLSLYLHIPFCHSLCYYCGCNRIVTRHKHKADEYLDYISQEITHRAINCKHKTIRQLHFGGGTPSFLSEQQLTRAVELLKSEYNFAKDIEMSIEIDPREIELSLIDHLKKLGFNRISIGVQDTNIQVQEAINRTQSFEFIQNIINRAKSIGFDSVNIDLIYGLPHQTQNTFSQTLADAISLDADRISLFSYAHLPSRFAAQRKIKDQWLPKAEEKFSLMKQAVNTLSQQGYELIGMDHFAKPNDELAIAQREGVLHRNFQGYTTLKDCDLLGFGVSAISSIGNTFSQNYKSLKEYYQAVTDYNQAVEKGFSLNQDDLIRQAVISELMCNLYIDKQQISSQFSIQFDQYFIEELKTLSTFENDNLLINRENNIQISPSARLLVRNICMSFDAYMKKHLKQQRFSRVI
ncbi:oxygen-independent coproporphyrinogen III oxidase [Paraglaciecola aquimarina]|uniref:Coproporphyrinogen-III oxidase n=1 Tax=Paraglaciecola algarum TaxID=3050085 RepID=A0ABS9D9L6_9ALTE|nr:oxygen-independent coproporphyrinogen III oxidase [Paraglaciecola sp. G1-23]MCF2948474.1 oxygen-independent coproporphyrinogen III oxidase [Paraglaciecola sp. G1-23]